VPWTLRADRRTFSPNLGANPGHGTIPRWFRGSPER
jgi:hypothetical protein